MFEGLPHAHPFSCEIWHYFLKRIIGKINSALSRPESCGSAVECHLSRTISFPQGLISFLARQYTRCRGVFLLVAGKIFGVGQP